MLAGRDRIKRSVIGMKTEISFRKVVGRLRLGGLYGALVQLHSGARPLDKRIKAQGGQTRDQPGQWVRITHPTSERQPGNRDGNQNGSKEFQSHAAKTGVVIRPGAARARDGRDFFQLRSRQRLPALRHEFVNLTAMIGKQNLHRGIGKGL